MKKFAVQSVIYCWNGKFTNLKFFANFLIVFNSNYIFNFKINFDILISYIIIIYFIRYFDVRDKNFQLLIYTIKCIY